MFFCWVFGLIALVIGQKVRGKGFGWEGEGLWVGGAGNLVLKHSMVIGKVRESDSEWEGLIVGGTRCLVSLRW